MMVIDIYLFNIITKQKR